MTEFETKTVYTYKNLLEFNYNYAKNRKVFWTLLAVIDAVFFACYALLLALGEVDAMMNLCLVLVLVISLLELFIFFLLPRFLLKKSPVLDATEVCTFTEKEITFHNELPSGKREGSVYYPSVYAVYVSKNLYIIYLDKTQALLIDKSNFDEESRPQFEAFLKSALGEKKIKF